MIVLAPRASSHAARARVSRAARRGAARGRDDEPRILFVLLALAVALYLVVWLVERPAVDEGPLGDAPAGNAAFGRS